MRQLCLIFQLVEINERIVPFEPKEKVVSFELAEPDESATSFELPGQMR